MPENKRDIRPLRPDRAVSTRPETQRPPRRTAEARACLILVVDDEPAICELLRDLFESPECMVIMATSGRQALSMARQLRPTMVVTDLSMPDLSGAEVCRILRREPETADIPLVLMSAWRGELTLCREEGCADAYVQKPFDLDAMERLVQSLLPGGQPPI